jgi:hypothetical protein
MKNKSKLAITKAIYNNLPDDNPYKEIPLEKLVFRWWWTGRSTEGLRLNEEGMTVCSLIDLEYFDFDFPLSAESHVFIGVTLGKKISCPYYIGFKNRLYKSAYIRIYDSKIAMLITLYGGIKDYLESIKK